MTVNQSVSYPSPPLPPPGNPHTFVSCSSYISRVVSLGVAVKKSGMITGMYNIFFSVDKSTPLHKNSYTLCITRYM